MDIKQYGLLMLSLSSFFAHSESEMKLSWLGVVPPISSGLERYIEINSANIQRVKKENPQLVVSKTINTSLSNNKVKYIVYTIDI
ncbi:hypothetical protein [Photobacterium damselae]|uniref:hypothetical protein n=1 Tax=Photobacterium damselae TaxID=38293 RepID=UPI0030F41C3B